MSSHTDTETKNIPALILFVDFEKAFDTIEWAFVEKTLQHLVSALL